MVQDIKTQADIYADKMSNLKTQTLTTLLIISIETETDVTENTKLLAKYLINVANKTEEDVKKLNL